MRKSIIFFNFMNMHLEIYYMYLQNMEIYCMFKVCCILLYFPQYSICLIILYFSVQIIYYLKLWMKIQISSLLGQRLTSIQLVWHLIIVHCLKNFVIWTKKCILYFNACTVHLLLFCTNANHCVIHWQIMLHSLVIVQNNERCMVLVLK
jgi:hypothetical protein